MTPWRIDIGVGALEEDDQRRRHVLKRQSIFSKIALRLAGPLALRLVDELGELGRLQARAPEVIAAELGLVAIVGVVGILHGVPNGSGRRAPELPTQHLELARAEVGRVLAGHELEIDAGLRAPRLQRYGDLQGRGSATD